MNIDNHTREVLQAMLDGKELLYKQGRPDWQASFWLLMLSDHDAEHITIAPEPKITTLYTYNGEGSLGASSGYWNNWTSQRYDSDTHYMQLDETGKQVAFGLIEELKA